MQKLRICKSLNLSAGLGIKGGGGGMSSKGGAGGGVGRQSKMVANNNCAR